MRGRRVRLDQRNGIYLATLGALSALHVSQSGIAQRAPSTVYPLTPAASRSAARGGSLCRVRPSSRIARHLDACPWRRCQLSNKLVGFEYCVSLVVGAIGVVFTATGSWLLSLPQR